MRTFWTLTGLAVLSLGIVGAEEPAAPAKPRVTNRPAIRLRVPSLASPAETAEKAKAAKSKVIELAIEADEVVTKAVGEVPAQADPAAKATHDQVAAIVVKGEGGSTLQTLTATPDGKIVCLVAPARHAPIGVAGKGAAPSEIRLFDSEGKETQRWSLPFTGQSVGVGPDGVIYAAGDGRLARYAADGKLLAEIDVPHLAEVLKDQDALKAKAELQIKQERLSLANAKKIYEDNVKRLEEKENRTDLEDKQLAAYQNYLKNYDAQTAAYKDRKIEDVVKQLTGRLRVINGIAATEKDVYIACGEMVGYGFAIWRMDADLTNPEKVLGPVSGCCGQMDIQASGDHFYLSENTKKRVAQYDRTGTLVSAFGKSGRASDGLSFGGCCNPMNCRVCANGDVFTSESEGIVKRFSAAGEFLGLVGYAKLTGGCKNVGVAASPKGDRVYLCDLPGSRIIIMAAKKTEAAE